MRNRVTFRTKELHFSFNFNIRIKICSIWLLPLICLLQCVSLLMNVYISNMDKIRNMAKNDGKLNKTYVGPELQHYELMKNKYELKILWQWTVFQPYQKNGIPHPDIMRRPVSTALTTFFMRLIKFVSSLRQ